MSNTLLVDDNDQGTPGDLNQLKQDLTEAVKRQPAESVEREVPEQESALPEKYRGKSVEDVVEMHRNAESELGRRSNELGQYKRLTDELLDLKRRDDLAKGGAVQDEPAEEPLPEISSTDLLENPTEAVTRLLDARDQRNEKKQRRRDEEAEMTAQQQAFAESHPDAQEIVNDADFVKWVGGNRSRALLGYQASQGDLVAGDALLTEWKESRSTEEPASEETEDTLSDARKATTESVGNSPTPDAPAGKVYRRLDLIRLKLEDPEAYADEAFQREIIRAYAEGRVK